MSKVVKYYYSSPITKVTMAFNPIVGKSVKFNAQPIRRYTIAAVFDDENQVIKFGLAICQPIDNFCKETGRQIARKNAEEHPFHIIKGFTGRRNDFADEVIRVMKNKETKLLLHDYPSLFNPKNFL